MFVKKSISNGRTFLVFAQGYRKKGKVRHKTIEKIGYLDDLKKQFDIYKAKMESLLISQLELLKEVNKNEDQ